MKSAFRDNKRDIRVLGSGLQPNIEEILPLRPDLVITWSFSPETVRFLEKYGLKVFAIYPESIQELYTDMRQIGAFTGSSARVDEIIREMESIFTLVRARTAKSRWTPPKMLWTGSRPNTVSGCHGINHFLIHLLDGQNVAGALAVTTADVPMETIVGWKPEVVLIWGYAKYDVKDILQSPLWQTTAAVRKRMVFKAPHYSTWSPMLALTALKLATQIYPTRFSDINLSAKAAEFIQKVFFINSLHEACGF